MIFVLYINMKDHSILNNNLTNNITKYNITKYIDLIYKNDQR